MNATDINRPDVHAEMVATFNAYEDALMTYDPDRLDAFFWADAKVARYGEDVCLYGIDAIAAFRRTMTSVPNRTLRNTHILTFGDSFATANTEFVHEGETSLGRQTQTWVRFPEGWRIVSAHISFLAPGTA